MKASPIPLSEEREPAPLPEEDTRATDVPVFFELLLLLLPPALAVAFFAIVLLLFETWTLNSRARVRIRPACQSVNRHAVLTR